ncbi:MAG: hypothetical protein Q4A78_07300 [Peptostreptococcaceae bacterium]|nr:hypothetical protein [Peptostreptococcaceae bacterium]
MKVELTLDIDLRSAGITEEEFEESAYTILADMLSGNIEEIGAKILQIEKVEEE